MISERHSEDLNVGTGVGNFKDGLAALASLAVTGAAVFTAASSKTDPLTGKSYWSEIEVAQGYPSTSGIIAPSQLETLAVAGITSISLQGTGNEGESIAGSPVTNRSTYTYTSGTTTTTGQVAAVEFATDTTGDIITTAGGGIVIKSVSEGGASSASSYIDTGATARTFQLSNGTLTDVTNNQVLQSNVTGVLATTENDTIRVAAGNTKDSWLGGGTGAATLDGSQGSGAITFLINSQTVVHGGSGFNMAQVTDGNPITVDLKTDNLQEVIGGTGDGTFNASGTTWNVFIQGGSGNNIIIGGYADAALSGGSGDDLIEGGPGGAVIHAGSGNDVIYGGSGATKGAPNSDIIYGGAGSDVVVLGTNNSAVFAGSGSMTLIGNDTQTVAATGAKAFSVVNFHGTYANYSLTHNSDGSLTVTDKVSGQDGPVTLENVTDISFSDLTDIPLNVVGVMPVNDTVTISGSGPYVIQASTLVVNDIEYAGNPLSIASLLDNNSNVIARGSSGQVNGGIAALSADGSQITFTPTAGFTGLPSFRYYGQDSLGNPDISVGLSLNNVPTGSSAKMSATVTLLTASEPADPGLPNEWYLQAADVLAAWAAGYTGARISIGVFDPSGNVDFTNPDLTANEGGEYLDTGAPGIDQIGLHATLVAGVIGATADGEGNVGVAYNATISSEAITSGTDTTDIVSGALANWANYAVVNNSWTAIQPYADDFDKIGNNLQYFQSAIQKGRGGLGTIIVFAAGNTRTTGGNTNNGNNTANPYEITVGGINATSDLGSLQFSGAPFSSPGASILVSAPANDINTTGVPLTNEFGQQSGSTTEITQGTSLAAPIVSGIVAMMLQANPNLGYLDVQQILAYTAKLVPSSTLAPTTWMYNGATDWNGGGLHVSNDYGFGEVDAAAAGRLSKTWSNVITSNNYSIPAFYPDDTLNQTVSYSLPVSTSGAPQIQDFQVEVQLWDATLSDLTITLTAPNGVVSTLMNQPQNAAMTGTATTTDGVVHPVFDYTFDTVQDLGASFAGSWTVLISGLQGSKEPGTIQKLAFIPEQVSPTPTYIYTDEYGSSAASLTNHSSTLTDTSANVALNASAVSTGMVLDLLPGSTDSVIAGQKLTIASNTTVKTVDGGAGNDTITGNNAGDTIVAGTGTDTIKGGAGNDSIILSGGSATIDGGSGVNAVIFTSANTVPDTSWAISENTAGAVVVDGTKAGYAGNATLTRIQTVEIGDSIFDLVATPQVGGTTTVSTPTDKAVGVVVVDGTGNDSLVFANTGTSYWHAGGGTDTVTLSAGTTDIYLQGAVGDYAVSSNSNGGLVIVDHVANRNGTKTILAGAGIGSVIFGDGSRIPIPILASASYAIAATDADKPEGNSGTTPFTFTVTRAGNNASVQTLTYAVTGSGANPANAADFVGNILPTGSVTFTGGATTEVITIPVAGDTVVEPDETFIVTLSGASNIMVPVATGTIINDDTAVGPSPGTTTADTYVWTNSSGGVWGVAGNWKDTSVSNAAIAAVAPGVNDLVTISGAAGMAFQTVSGSGNAASLTLVGNTALNGTFNASALAVGTLSSTGSLTLAAGSTLTTNSAVLVNGFMQVEGAGTKLTVSGALTLDPWPGTSSVNTVNVSGGAAVQVGSLVLNTVSNGFNQLAVDSSSTFEVGTSGSAAAGKVTVDAGRILSGFGQVGAWIIDQGTIIAQGGSLILGQLTGNGVVQIASGSTLTLPSSSTNTVNVSFDGPGATLDLSPIQTASGASITYAFVDLEGVIGGFGVGDTINYYDNQAGTLPLTSAVYQSAGSGIGTLTLGSGNTTLGKLTLSGNYTGDTFKITKNATQSYNVTLRPEVAADFNGDGQSDLLLQNDNGAIVFYGLNGLAVNATAFVNNAGPTWHVVGEADFNGDGKPDILLQNDNGSIVDYLMNGTTVTGAYSFSNPGSGWHVRGTGDFNGDGKADMLLQNDNGAMVLFDANGTGLTAGYSLGQLPVGWSIEGVGDFNGDGVPDVLVESNTGTLVDFTTNSTGTGFTSGGTVANVGPGWSIAGIADYNGDGKADILLHNDNGADVVFYMNGSTVTGTTAFGNPGAAYQGAVTGIDINGDGTPDVVVQGTSSTLVGYTLGNNAAITAGSVLNTPGAGWKVSGGNPITFIDGTGSNLALTGTPGPDQFNLTSTAAGNHILASFDPAQDTVALSLASFPSYAAVQAHETAYQGGTSIGLPSAAATIIIQGVTPSQLSSSNFVLR